MDSRSEEHPVERHARRGEEHVRDRARQDHRPAEPLLLVSLIAAVFTFLPYVVVPGVRDNVSTNDIAFALLILAITWTIFWFARHSRQRGWLR